MINRCVILFLTLFINTSIYAHFNIEPGISGGLSIYKINYDESRWYGSNNYKYYNGFTAGALIDLGIFKFLSVEPSIIYSKRGAFIEQTSPYPSGYSYYESNLYTFEYLSLPIYIKIKYSILPHIAPYGLAGLNTSFILSAKRKTISYVKDLIDSSTTIEDITRNQHTIDCGLNIGAGFEISLRRIMPFIEYVHYFPLRNAINNSNFYFTGKEIKCGVKFKL
jgi:hypothetical protein